MSNIKFYTEEQVRKAIELSLLNAKLFIHKGLGDDKYFPTVYEALKNLTPIELPSDEEIEKVKAIKDESGHWYIIPNELVKEFHKDESNEDMIDSGEFGNKWGGYMTGGGLNLVQLYAKKQILNQNK
jgi:hypothetical protein